MFAFDVVWSKWIIVFAFLWAFLCGCGEQDASKTYIRASKWSGLTVSDTKDNDIELQGSFSPSTGELKIDQFKLRNNASDPNMTLPAIIGANMLYQKQLGDNAIGIVDSVSNLINTGAQAVMPMVTQYLSGRTSVALAKQSTKQMAMEMVGGIAGGFMNTAEIQNTLPNLPMEVQDAVLSDPVVLAKLDQLADELSYIRNKLNLKPATQPSEP